MSRVLEHRQRRFDAIVRHEQPHACRSAFHAHVHSDDDRGYASSVQCDLRQMAQSAPGRPRPASDAISSRLAASYTPPETLRELE
jgi:hypothetical protein